MKKRLLSIICVLTLCLGLLPTTVFAASPEGVWTDHAASNFAGGTGTENDPYQIATAEQLAYLAVKANEGTLHSLGDYYILINNIDLSDHRWIPIGRGTSIESKYFDGYFNGMGKTITGLYVDESTDGYLAGLFGLLTGQVTDLTIEGAYVKTAGSNSSAGILAGKIINSGTKVTNCHVSGTVEGDVSAGGLAGYASYTEFKDCSAKAEVSATGNNIGGFIGEGFATSFSDCTAEGSVTGSWCCGGFAGLIWCNAQAERCSADVDVTASDWNTGGFVGFIEQNTTISKCVALGDVSNPITGTTTKLGGFVGSVDTTHDPIKIQNCHSVGVVSGGTDEHPAGGFVGFANSGTITDCAFSAENNPGLDAVGEPAADDAFTIDAASTSEVLANICEDYYGGHQYGEAWVVETEATCTTAGSKYQVCARCGTKGNVTVILATGHSLIKTDAQDPTCTKAGNSAYWTCENCEKVFGDEKGETETSLAETVVQATGHNYVNGICTKCGAVLSQPAPQPSGPSTDNSDGWTEIEDEVAETPAGSTVTVDMNGTTEVPAKVFEAVAGKDVTLELDMGGGVKWEINGQDIPTDLDFTDLDLGVKLNTSTIPVDVINLVTGEKGAVQMTLAHDGEFGFTMTLTAPLGTENKGLWANLYHYNTPQKRMLFETAAKVDANGNVSLPFTHASEYAIVLDEKSHELPFTDVADGDWFQAAVEYVYRQGIMAGTSATTFEPNTPLSRAMVAQILYNLEGQPTVTGESTFTDVSGHWAIDAITWAQKTGVVTGYENNTFRPNQAVTREELAQVLYNYAQYKKITLPALGDLSKFPDGDKVSPWARTAMKWATGLGVINGYEDSTLEPGGDSTRAQAASILMNFDVNLVEE